MSNDLIDFIEKLDLKKISSQKMMILGSRNAVENICDFEKRILSDIGLKNLLTFFKNDEVSTEFLVKRAFEEKSVSKIALFLFNFKDGFDKDFLLTEVLQIYRSCFDLEIINEEIYSLINETFQSYLLELKTFNIFDIFESSELVKAKGP